MSSTTIGLLVAIIIIAAIVIVYFKVSATQRMCPSCRSMMPIKKTACPKCRKLIPLNY